MEAAGIDEQRQAEAEAAAKFIGTIKHLADEQELMQKKTFTNWMNSYLKSYDPPMHILDLYEDIKDGVKLLCLLEVLSGEKLPKEKGRKMKRIHYVSNISTAKEYLLKRGIQLVNINASDVADGKPSIVLGLIWNIILYFQIEENTRILSQQGLVTPTGSTSSLNSDDSGRTPRKSRTPQRGGSKKLLLNWAQKAIAPKYGIEVKDFGPSWRDGKAFSAMINNIDNKLIDMSALSNNPNRVNLENAFYTAETHLGIPKLLDPEDVDKDKPDEKSIMTYVAKFLEKYPDPDLDLSSASDAKLSIMVPDDSSLVERIKQDFDDDLSPVVPSRLLKGETLIAFHSPQLEKRQFRSDLRLCLSATNSPQLSPLGSPTSSRRAFPELDELRMEWEGSRGQGRQFLHPDGEQYSRAAASRRLRRQRTPRESPERKTSGSDISDDTSLDSKKLAPGKKSHVLFIDRTESIQMVEKRPTLSIIRDKKGSALETGGESEMVQTDLRYSIRPHKDTEVQTPLLFDVSTETDTAMSGKSDDITASSFISPTLPDLSPVLPSTDRTDRISPMPSILSSSDDGSLPSEINEFLSQADNDQPADPSNLPLWSQQTFGDDGELFVAPCKKDQATETCDIMSDIKKKKVPTATLR